MQVHFVGHASVVLDYGDVVLLTDPWTVGDAFNDAWTAWPAPQLDPSLLQRVTHLWISHEHPDHLSIPTLRSIPEEQRARIHVLYQTPWSAEVPTFLHRLGWASVRELPHGVFQRLAADVDVCVYQVGHEDSALIVRGRGTTVLELNDCKPGPRSMRRLKALAGPVDVLLDQFSIAGWPGNPDQTERIGQRSAAAVDTFASHVTALDPRWVVPFASFVRFSHVENAYINDATVPVDRAVQRVGISRSAVLAPGDSWSPDEQPPTDAALARYALARAQIAEQPLRAHEAVSFDDVLAAAERRVGQLRDSYQAVVRRVTHPVTFQITDHDRALVFDTAHAAVTTCDPVLPGREAGRCVVDVSSQAARAAFTDRWGLPTLLISGRVRLRGEEAAFMRLKQLGAAYSTGLHTKGGLRHLLGSPRGRHLVRRRAGSLIEDYART